MTMSGAVRNILDRNGKAILDLRNLGSVSKEALTALIKAVSTRREQPPGLWVLLLGEDKLPGAAAPERFQPLSDLIQTLIETAVPAAAVVRGLVSGESLILLLFSIFSAAGREVSVRLPGSVRDTAEVAASFLLSLKLGPGAAERLQNGPLTLNGFSALEAGILSVMDEDPEAGLDRWRQTSPLADGSREARLLYQGMRWRFHAAFRTGLVELEDLVGPKGEG